MDKKPTPCRTLITTAQLRAVSSARETASLFPSQCQNPLLAQEVVIQHLPLAKKEGTSAGTLLGTPRRLEVLTAPPLPS